MKNFLSYAILAGSIIAFNEAAFSMDEKDTPPPKKVLFRKSKLFQEEKNYLVTGKQIKKILNNIDGEIGYNEYNSTARFSRYDPVEGEFPIGVCALNLDPTKLSDLKEYTFRWQPKPVEHEDEFIQPCSLEAGIQSWSLEAESADDLNGIWFCLGAHEDEEPFAMALDSEW
jgi:hypothetical protein